MLLAAGMAALYHYVPNTDVRWRHALAGGVFVAVGLRGRQARRWPGTWARCPTYSMVYGAFATLPILLLWIYLGWVIVLLRRGDRRLCAQPADAAGARGPTRRASASRWRWRCCASCSAQRAVPPHGLTLAQLAASQRIDPLQVEPLLELLLRLDWVARLDEDGRPALRAAVRCRHARRPSR